MSHSRSKTYTLAVIALMAAVTCILGPLSLSIPLSPVPISFTNLAIYLSLFLLGWKRGTLCYLLYLAIGLIGVPVFSGFTGGPSKLIGPTGGYLIGFIFMALIGGKCIETFEGHRVLQMLGLALGTAAAYLFGTVWLCFLMKLSFLAGLGTGVLPFLPGDCAKILIVGMIGPNIRKRLKQVGYL